MTAVLHCGNLQSLSSSEAFRILDRCSGSVMFNSLRWDSPNPAKSSRVWKPCMDSKELSSWRGKAHSHEHSGGHSWCKQQVLLHCDKHQGGSYIEANAVQHLLQGFGFGLRAVGPVVAVPLPGRGAFLRQQVYIDELKRAHFVVQFPCPGPHRGLLNDMDDVSFLEERWRMSARLSHDQWFSVIFCHNPPPPRTFLTAPAPTFLNVSLPSTSLR